MLGLGVLSTTPATNRRYLVDKFNGNRTQLSHGGEEDFDFHDYETYPEISDAISLMNGILGLPTILLMIAVTTTKSYRRHSYSLYLTTMSFYDFTFIMIDFSNTIHWLTHRTNNRYILMWDVPCRFYEYFIYVSEVASMWLNVGLAADRFIVIAFPFKKQLLCTRKTSWIICGGLMLAIHGVGLVYFVYAYVHFYADNNTSYCLGRAILDDFDFIMKQMCGLLPSVALIFILSMASVLKLIALSAKRRDMTSTASNKAEKTSKATISLVTIGFSTLLTQLPFLFDQVYEAYLWEYDYYNWVLLVYGQFPSYTFAMRVCIGLSYAVYFQNFYILFAMNGQFRQDVLKLLGIPVKSKKRSSSRTGMTSTFQSEMTEVTTSTK